MTQFFIDNADLIIPTFAILAFLLIVQTVRVCHFLNKYKDARCAADNWMLSFEGNTLTIFDLQKRLADAEKVINALNGRVVKIRDEKTGQYVSYKDIKKYILQYENKYFKKDKSACQ